MVQGPPPKPKLSTEEARKQAEDMVRKAKERREVRLWPRHVRGQMHLRLAFSVCDYNCRVAVIQHWCRMTACLLCICLHVNPCAPGSLDG